MDDDLCVHCELYACENCEELHALGRCCCGRVEDPDHDLCDHGERITDPCDECDSR